MRFLSLSLLAYGPFTNLVLDLSSPARGLHLLYGANEAGKSTTLRAITGFLYGIPRHTPDAYLHKMPDLRVGARMEGAGGAVLDVVRRKGTVNTLLDQAGSPVDEAALRRLLGGVGEELFGVMFGLSHDALRQGAEALLQGKGDLGESLFGAGLGQSALHDVREELEREAEELFTQKARVRPLNDAIRAFAEAQKKVRDSSLPSEHWLKQKQELEEGLDDQRRRADEKRRLQARQHKLRRARQALPLLAKHRQLAARLEALAGAVRLPESSTREREEASRTAADGAERADRLVADIGELEARRAGLVVPRSLLEQRAIIEDIQGRFGAYRKTQTDLPKLRGELRQLQHDAHAILRRLGDDGPLERVEAKRVDAATQARIKKLALQPAALEEKLRGAQRNTADVASRLEAQRARLASLPPPKEAGALRRAIAAAQRQGDLEQRLRNASADHQLLEQAATGKLAALGLWSGPLTSVASLPLPSMETVDHAEKEWSSIEKKIERATRELEEIQARRAELDRAIDEIERAGAVPTEAELARARSKRDDAWERVRRALGSARGDPAPDATIDAIRSLTDMYEQTVRHADEISDRLRREASRVEKLAGRLAEREAGSRRAEGLRLEREGLERAQAKASSEWRALFTPAGIDPRSPAEMRGWLARHSSLVAQIEQLNAVAVERDGIRRQIKEHREDINAALEAAREPVEEEAERRVRALGEGEDLASVLERGERVLASLERDEREREQLVPAIDSLHKEKERLARESEMCARELATWKESWAKSVMALGLGREASPEDATSTLDQLGELFQKVDEIKKTQRHLDLLERAASAFEDDVAALATGHAADLEDQPAEQAAAQLVRRYQEGAAADVERIQAEKELRAKRRELDEQRKRRAAAEERLASLMQRAGAQSLVELEAAELRAQEIHRIEHESAEIDDRLVSVGEGATREALAQEVFGMDMDRVAVELEENERDLLALEDRRTQEDRRLGGLEADLNRLGKASAAAEAAADAQESLARIRGLVDRYLRSRIAAIVLAREIERYRERNQGPILARASELFQRLTLGAYSGLRAGYDEKDQPILRCVRADGGEVEVVGLSDGARDQLFLSLRLASLERYSSTNEPMPLIVDDILIHFDDDRARAALEALGELAERTQILFFTHHARLLELARQAIPGKRLREHHLR